MRPRKERIEAETRKPRWAVIATAVCIVLAIVTAASVGAFLYSRQGSDTTQAVQTQGNYNECVTRIQSARRSVFDNVDIYKAIQIEQLSAALLASRQGIAPTQDLVDAFEANDKKLKAALVEARRLQPSSVLGDLIAHGGTIDGKQYAGCLG